jgi:riboflavin biosynthesis pyrimidine reductase
MLLPEPAADVDLAQVYGGADRPAPPDRPWVLLNMVASADGGTAVGGLSGPLGGDPDRRVFPHVRAAADVIVAAAGTVRAERYGPPRTPPALRAQRRDRGQAELPRLAIVTASLDLDPGWTLFTEAERRPYVLTTEDAPGERIRALEPVAEVLRAGTGRVDLPAVLGLLAAAGERIVLCEGGPSLNGQLLAAGLVDELCLTLAPLAVGGTSARIAHGPEVVPEALALTSLLEEDGVLFLRYLRGRALSGPAPSVPSTW